MMSLPPVFSETNPTIQAMSPLDTMHDGDASSTSSATFPTLSVGRRPSRLLMPALIFAGIGLFAAAVAAGRYFLRPTFVEIPPDEPTSAQPPRAVEVLDPPAPIDEPTTPARPARKRPAARGFIVIDASVPGLVSVGGKDYGMTPVKLTLSVGRHKVKVATPDGSRSGEVDLSVLAGGNGRKTVQLR